MRFFGSFNEEKSLDFRSGLGYCGGKSSKATLNHKGENRAMKSIITELYNGNIFPAETDMPTDNKYRINMSKVGREIEELQKVLTGEQYEKLEHMLDLNAEVVNMENRAMYAAGIRFGIELMVEVYSMNEHKRILGC